MTDNQIHDKRIELKYVLDAKLSLEVRQWAREHLGVDGHCNDALGDSYDVNTLYLDTAELDIFHRSSDFGKAKHRIRRYGDDSTLWVETKRKKANVVKKNRTATSEQEVESRLTDLSDQTAWCGDWFSDRVVQRQLQPTVQVHYRRFARTSILGGESLRLTIDSQLQASPIDGWNVASTSDVANHAKRMAITSDEILELKFHNQMPHLFKELLRTFAIPATGFSKYRTAVANIPRLRFVITDVHAGILSQAMVEETADA
ncbi:polyphosphate polymerase domain-containing protein [Rubripirellula reticaptiva]|uniref:VTC domain protein n=1 Tax=Rubripirellula reticaptiva TaxID=2528013 RepID=A0A5C6F140_9BACT|nr:polyphosphate polymerase domain-containing protein [Rubripirellula reticaptiva]TWU55543.1 VTC domain protein [Rubripirellula reticaptiva]